MNRPEPQTTEQDEETPVPHEPPPRKAPDLERDGLPQVQRHDPADGGLDS